MRATLPAKRKASYRMILLVLMFLFTCEFIVRGPLRFLSQGSEFNDFVSPLVQSRIFVGGNDPYDPFELIRFWPKETQPPTFLRKDVQEGTAVSKDGVPSPYPPTCFALLSPISVLPWHFAKLLCLTTNCICVLILIYLLLSLSRLRAASSRAYLFVALTLGFAPLHTALASGNLILPVCAAGVGAIWCSNRRYATAAGALLVIATCLKPPVGIVFLVHNMLRRRWRESMVGIGLSGIIAGATALRMWFGHVNWIGSYSKNIHDMFALGAINDFTTLNPLRFHLLNLQMLAYLLSDNRRLAMIGSWLVVLGLLAWLMTVKRHEHETELLELSALATIALLPVYHRFTDGILLILPLCWAIATDDHQLQKITRVVLLLLLPFLLPGASLLHTLAKYQGAIDRLASSWWWQRIVVPHEVWAILAISVVLLFALHLKTTSTVQAIIDPSAGAVDRLRWRNSRMAETTNR